MKKLLVNLSLIVLAGASLIYSPGCQKSKGIILSEPAVTSTKREALETMLDSSYKINVKALYVNKFHQKIETHRQGLGFLAEVKDGKQYFLTSEHIIDVPPLIEDYKLTDLIITAGEKEREVYIVRKRNNITILRSNEDLGLKKLVDFSKKDFSLGDSFYTIGFHPDLGKFLKPSSVTSVVYDTLFFEYQPSSPGGAQGVYFSDGLFYVLEKGKPKFVGVGEFSMLDEKRIFGSLNFKNAKKELDKVLQK